MNPKQFWVMAVAALSGQPVSAAFGLNPTEEVTRPNFLVVVCEDISPYLGVYGDSVAVTPNLDAFGKQGVVHTHMFTSVGVSSPSRYSLITGRYSSTDGANYMRVNHFNKAYSVVPPKEVKCFSELLRQAGYYVTNNVKTDYQFTVPASAWDEQGVRAHWKNRPKGQPFLSIFNLNSTHESQIWKQKDSPLLVDPERVNVPPYFPDNEVVRKDMAVMYSNIARMDQQFQKLLSELEESDEARNTIVIFYSDNGGPLPRGKREILDSGTRVPFMIRFPNGAYAGSLNNELQMFVDIPATLLSLADIDVPNYMHGKPFYGDQKKEVRSFVFGATDRFDEQVEKRASIRSDRYLYVYNYMNEGSNYRPNAYRLSMPMMQNMLDLQSQGKLNENQSRWFKSPADREELYDVASDPYQLKNLVGSKQHKAVLKSTRKAFQKEWIKKYNKDWSTQSEAFFVNRSWPSNSQQQTESPIAQVRVGRLEVENALDPGLSVTYQINGEGLNQNKKHWILYSNSVELKKGDTVTVRANRIGFIDSPIITLKY